MSDADVTSRHVEEDSGNEVRVDLFVLILSQRHACIRDIF